MTIEDTTAPIEEQSTGDEHGRDHEGDANRDADEHLPRPHGDDTTDESTEVKADGWS